MGYKRTDPILEKIPPDEPIFVLRGQDRSSPKVILHWIAKNFETAPDYKLREAFDHAIAMKNHHTRKDPD